MTNSKNFLLLIYGVILFNFYNIFNRFTELMLELYWLKHFNNNLFIYISIYLLICSVTTIAMYRFIKFILKKDALLHTKYFLMIVALTLVIVVFNKILIHFNTVVKFSMGHSDVDIFSIGQGKHELITFFAYVDELSFYVSQVLILFLGVILYRNRNKWHVGNIK